MSGDFALEHAALIMAIGGKVPPRSHYAHNIDLDKARSGSANHKCWSNPTEALCGILEHQPARTAAVMQWAEYFALPTDSGGDFFENEALTPSSAYRTAITEGGWVLAGIAQELGNEVLCDMLLDRARADVAWAMSGVAAGPVKLILDHHPNAQNVAHLFVGDGERKQFGGIALPYFAQAGKRVHVRQGKDGHRFGPLGDEMNTALLEIVAQTLDVPSNLKNAGKIFKAARARWPNLPPYGFSPEQIIIAKAFVRNPTDVLLAQAVYKWARAYRPSLPFDVVHYDDAAVEFFFRHLDGSSTGGRAADIVFSDGTHYLVSADTGHRDSAGDPTHDVRPQDVVETPEFLIAKWSDGQGVEIRGPRPRSNEIWRIVCTPERATFLVAGVTLPPPPPGPHPAPVRPPKPAPAPAPKPRPKRWWEFWL